MSKFKSVYFILVLILSISCGKEEFSAKKQKKSDKSPITATNNVTLRSHFTLIRPQVDLLFIWDNSTSTNFINEQTKQSLNNVINYVSDRFDYNIMMSPLIGTGNNYSYFFSYSGLVPGSGITVINKSTASSILSQFPTATGNAEAGAQRAVDLIKTNITNHVFRQNAYQIIVIMSNDDDNSYITGNYDTGSSLYIANRSYDLLCLRGNYSGPRPSGYTGTLGVNCAGATTPSTSLNSSGMRFISIIAEKSSTCSNSSISNYKLNKVYKAISERIYTGPYNNGTPLPTDQTGESSKDVYDICNEQYSHIFDGVNNAITDTIIKHIYNFWPVANTSQTVDESTISVKMSDGRVFYKIPNTTIITKDPIGKYDIDQFNNPVNGWRFISGNVTNQNTRFYPSAGEPYTGKVIELFGDAKVTYPLFLDVNSNATKEYFGYVHLNSKPLESSVVLKINGTVIPQSSTNGWQLVKSGGTGQYISNKNIKVLSPTDHTPATPAYNKTGYFLKVHGTAVYTNGATIDVQYLPQGS